MACWSLNPLALWLVFCQQASLNSTCKKLSQSPLLTIRAHGNITLLTTLAIWPEKAHVIENCLGFIFSFILLGFLWENKIFEIAGGILLAILALLLLPFIILLIHRIFTSEIFAIIIGLIFLAGSAYAIFYFVTTYPEDLLEILKTCVAIAVIVSICYGINWLLTAYVNRKVNLGIYKNRAEASKAIADKAATSFLRAIVFIPTALVISIIVIAFVYRGWWLVN